MYSLEPRLDAVLTELGITDLQKGALVNFLVSQTSSTDGQIAGLRANATNLTNQAEALVPVSENQHDMLTKLTVVVDEDNVDQGPVEGQ